MKFLVPFLVLFAFASATDRFFCEINKSETCLFYNAFLSDRFPRDVATFDKCVPVETFREFMTFMKFFPSPFMPFTPRVDMHTKMFRVLTDFMTELFKCRQVEVVEFVNWAKFHLNPVMFYHAFFTAFMRFDTMREKFLMPRPSFVLPEMFFPARFFYMKHLFDTNPTFFTRSKGLDHFFSFENETVRVLVDLPVTDMESRINYFTHDVEMNEMMFFFFNFVKTVKQPGDFVFFFFQQFMSRFFMERFANGLDRVEELDFSFVPVGFTPDLVVAGTPFMSRPDNFMVTAKNFEAMRVESDMLHFFRTKFMVTPTTDRTMMKFVTTAMDDVVRTGFFRKFWMTVGGFFGTTPDTFLLTPETFVTEFAETAMRDPMFFQVIQRFMNTFFFRYRVFKDFIVETPDVTSSCVINEFTISKMTTFFEFFDTKVFPKFFARRTVINHMPFNVTFDFTCDVPTDMEVSFFMAPFVEGIDMFTNRESFFLLDRFDLVTSFRKDSRSFRMTRRSDEFTTFGRTNFMTTDLRFPSRFILPRGLPEGRKFFFVAVIAPKETTRFISTFNPFTFRPGSMFFNKFMIFHTDDRFMKNMVMV